MPNKKFIVFEGNEGTGKSTHIKFASNQKNYFVEGDVQNENSVLNDELLKLFNLNFKNNIFPNFKRVK